MTGHQTTPASEDSDSGRSVRPVSLYDVVKAVGVERISKVDAYDPPKLIEAVREFVLQQGVNVIIVERACAIISKRNGEVGLYEVLPDLCTGCDVCINLLGCPALTVEGDKVVILEEECTGCGLCAGICPYKAIVEVEPE
jgi:indolepyruvate ferredoxin oxidoreductase alpha subunit